MSAEDCVVVEGVELVVSHPRFGHLGRPQLRHAVGEHRQHLVFPDVLRVGEVIDVDRGVGADGWAADQVVVRTVGTHVNPGGVDGQRQILIQWCVDGEDVGVAAPGQTLAQLL